ncbi:MAG: twin-arginine translocation signal domain-containing protein, partial [Xanthobacteraceae bacterium]
MRASEHFNCPPSRRRFLRSAGILGGMVATFPAWADTFVDLDLPGGPDRRELTTAFPQKGPMILQRTRPPLL